MSEERTTPNTERNSFFEAVSTHLGKAGDGTVVKPYVTPTSIDPSLLVAIPRSFNRRNLDVVAPCGLDTWNCYEFSMLLPNGYPYNAIIKIDINALSTNIVESKSLKLFLNSFNMAKVGENWFIEECKLDNSGTFIYDLEFLISCYIENKLTKILDPNNTCIAVPVSVQVFPLARGNQKTSSSFPNVQPVESYVQYGNLPETNFHGRNAAILKKNSLLSSRPGTQKFRTGFLRSNCRVTNQPDWGDVYVHIKYGENSHYEISPVSFLEYITSFRNENHFHEEICEMIYSDIQWSFNPEELAVGCFYTRRGGIDINPMRASSYSVLWDFFGSYFSTDFPSIKTERQ